MKHIFIMNPVAGRKAAEKIFPLIKDYFEHHEGNYQIIKTDYIGHARRIAQQYTSNDDVCLYAVGGDGTLWEVVNGLNPDVPLSLIPCGTGNDFFRLFEVDRFDLPLLIQRTIEGEIIEMDYGIVNDKYRFINCVCMGMDANVNYRVCEKGKKSLVPKKLLYVSSAIKEICQPSLINYQLKYNGGEREGSALLTTIMNGRYYGGGFCPTPNAEFNDGLFDVCQVDNLPLYKLPASLYHYSKGQHDKIKKSFLFQTDQIDINLDSEMEVCIDGESFLMKEVRIKMVKHGLKLKIPEGSYKNANKK